MRYIQLLWLVALSGLFSSHSYAQCPPGRPNPNLGSDRTVCVNQSVSLSSGDNNAQHLWTVNGNIVRQDPNDPNSPPYNQPTYNFNPTRHGAYRIIVATYYNGCPDTLRDTVDITVDPLPQAPDLGPNREVCISELPLTLDATRPGAIRYIWLQDGNPVGNQPQYTFSFAMPGQTYTIIARVVFNNACTGGQNDTLSDTLSLTVIDQPRTPDLGPDREVCVNSGPITFNTNIHDAQGYVWLVNGRQVGNQSSYQHNILRPGRDTIVVQVTYNNACTSGRDLTLVDTVYLTISPLPQAPNLGRDRELCASVGSVTLEAPAGATRYIWIVNRNELSGQTGQRYTHTLRAGRDTIVARAVFNNACTGGQNDTLSDTLHLTISPAPEAEITRRGDPIPNGETIQIGSNTVTTVRDTFRAASQVQGNLYRWELYNPQATQPSRTAAGVEFIHTFFIRGEHMLVLKSINGACTELDTIYINVTLRQGGTGLGESESASFFVVYPNPSTGTFILQAPADTYKLSLQDMTGRLLHTEAFQGEQKEIRLSLPAGLYLLTLESPTQRGTLPLWITE